MKVYEDEYDEEDVMSGWPDNMRPPDDEDDYYYEDEPVTNWDKPEPPWKDEK